MTEMTCYRFFLFSVVIFQMMEVCAEIKLTGTVIGTEESVDYKSGAKTTTINTCADVFDGNLEILEVLMSLLVWLGRHAMTYMLRKGYFRNRNR